MHGEIQLLVHRSPHGPFAPFSASETHSTATVRHIECVLAERLSETCDQWYWLRGVDFVELFRRGRLRDAVDILLSEHTECPLLPEGIGHSIPGTQVLTVPVHCQTLRHLAYAAALTGTDCLHDTAERMLKDHGLPNGVVL